MNKLLFYYLAGIFILGCLIRSAPIIINYPLPIGYDSINYYIPNLYHFDNNLIVLVTSFPVFISTVYLFSHFSNISLYHSFLGSNVILYGLFSVSVYLLSNKILNQSYKRSLIFTVFVIFQLGALRISWDLFRNLFSISLFNFFLLILFTFKKNNTLGHFIPNLSIFLISIVIIFSDRLIGILLIISSFVLSIVYKQKYLFMINSFFTISFLYYFLSFDKITFVSSNIDFFNILLNPLYGKNSFSQLDIFILFLSMYSILIPFLIPGLIMARSRDNMIIKIPLMITMIFSFTWIFVPNYSFLVPERWLLILGIYLSLFSIYGFYLLTDFYLKTRRDILKNGIILSFLSFFVIYGILFIVVPSGNIYSLPSFFQEHTGFILPNSMNFNSLQIKDNQDLLKSIEWINSNTPENSIIIGTKHWRGWFSLFLHKTHNYTYFEEFVNSDNTILNEKQIKNFSISLNKKFANLCNGHKFNNNKKSLYFIDLIKRYDTSLFSHVVFKSKNFIIYNLDSEICKD
ncbi:MAG TPA: hypothetical protein VN704_00465 [Verrucomicrobiae bacterium]|nr:hypothetical protein [Verrucomicrobiae bacterium]